MADLYQVILMANDVGRLVEFYRDIVGLKVTYPKDSTDLGSEEWITLDAGGTTLAIHGGGEVQGSGSVQLSLRIDDVNAIYTSLKARGVDIDEPHGVGPSVVSAKARDPEGNVLSFDEIKTPADAASG